MLNHPHILIVGASGRFLAQSASLAGYEVSVIDLFGDLDTKQFCEASQSNGGQKCLVPTVRRVNALSDLVDELPLDTVAKSNCLTVLFSGGTENFSEFFDRKFWGTASVAGPSRLSIEHLLCWRRVEKACRKHQIQLPSTILDSDARVDVSEKWLIKRIRSGGGLQVQRWTGAEPVDFNEGEYLQKELSGPTISGCYVASEIDGQTNTALLGACQQLPHEAPDDFRYRGSVGPVTLSECDQKEVERVGQCIASEFSLTGVFGIDFIASGGRLFLVDINPRIPASAELIERYYRSSRNDFTIIGVHLAATLRGQNPTPISDFSEGIFSKRVVYLESKVPLLVDEALVEYFRNARWISDIPAIGTLIQPGHPVVTVHAASTNRQAAIVETIKRTKELQVVLSASATKV